MPLVELDPEPLLDPGKRVFLADGENDVIAGNEYLARDTLRGDAAARIDVVFHGVEVHAGESAVHDDEGFRRVIDHDLDILGFGVLELPVGGLEESTRLAGHHLDVRGAEAQRGAAAVHRCVADTDDQNALADLVEMTEGNRFQPLDADVDVGVAFLAAWQVEFLALGCAATDKDCVEPARGEEACACCRRGCHSGFSAPIPVM